MSEAAVAGAVMVTDDASAGAAPASDGDDDGSDEKGGFAKRCPQSAGDGRGSAPPRTAGHLVSFNTTVRAFDSLRAETAAERVKEPEK